jgi:hypothetical protein
MFFRKHILCRFIYFGLYLVYIKILHMIVYISVNLGIFSLLHQIDHDVHAYVHDMQLCTHRSTHVEVHIHACNTYTELASLVVDVSPSLLYALLQDYHFKANHVHACTSRCEASIYVLKLITHSGRSG